MVVNGKAITLEHSVSLKQWLEENGYGQGRVAVERDGDIVPKTQYDKVFLSNADRLEIVHFVGGG